MTAEIRGVLVDATNALLPSGGGVQVCNEDYRRLLGVAGFALTEVPFDLDTRFPMRIVARIYGRMRSAAVPRGLTERVRQAVAEQEAQFVFFGLTRFTALSRDLRRSLPNVKQVLLSHGTETIDYCIAKELAWRNGARNRSTGRTGRVVGVELLGEFELRRYIDAALTLSSFEEELEKWFGTPVAKWIPRFIRGNPLNTVPVDGRVGCVATLSHPPNKHGLWSLCDALARRKASLEFRIVGGPEHEGRMLSDRYSFVNYLGPLGDEALRYEASSWCCFVNPLFVNAKGCSTKLALGLGWNLPIATTGFGARGYQWDPTLLPLAHTAEELAETVEERSRADSFREGQSQTQAVAQQMPSISEVAAMVRRNLVGG